MGFFYHNPVKINFDINLFESLKEFQFSRALLITSQSFSKSGITQKLQDVLKQKLAFMIDDIKPNPQLSYLQNLKKTLADFDSIIALGGGSVLDSAKFLSIENEIIVSDENLCILPLNNDLKQKREILCKPIFAFPTTAGTGSELTKWATIWDNNAMKKYSLQDESLYPKAAFYDISLTLSLDRNTTITTGLDALSHACESIWNKNANPISERYALDSINLIVQTLPRLAKNPDSIALRKDMMYASMYAALAFSNTQTALAHAISYPITMRFGIPHGLACSFSIPLLLDSLPQCKAKDLLKPYISAIKDLFAQLDVSTNPKDYGLDSVFIEEIFTSLNARAKNGVFDIMQVRQNISDIM